MGEMLTYIFSSLRSSEKRLDVVTRAVSKQRSFNKQITIFAALTTANLVVMKIEQKDQALRIRKLERKLRNLSVRKESKKCDDRLYGDFNTFNETWSNRNLSKVHY